MLNKRTYVEKTRNKEEWCAKSEKGRNMGCYPSKSKAKHRLQQVEYFKHKKATTYNDKEQEAAESHWKGSPLGDGDDIGATHKFPANSNDVRNRRRPGYFKWLNKYQVTPYTASPADFVSSPMQSMMKEARESDAAFEKKIQQVMPTWTNTLVTINPNNKKGNNGVEEGIAYGIITLRLNPTIKLNFTTQMKNGDYFTEIDWTSGGDVKSIKPLMEYLTELAKENGPKYLESGGDANKFKELKKKKEKRTTPTNKPDEQEVVDMLKTIPDSKFKEKEIKGQTWHQYTMPIDEFKQLAEKSLIKYTYFTQLKSSMPNGEFIWKINPDGVLILK